MFYLVFLVTKYSYLRKNVDSQIITDPEKKKKTLKG